MFEILEYKPYKRNAKQIIIKTAKNITINLNHVINNYFDVHLKQKNKNWFRILKNNYSIESKIKP